MVQISHTISQNISRAVAIWNIIISLPTLCTGACKTKNISVKLQNCICQKYKMIFVKVSKWYLSKLPNGCRTRAVWQVGWVGCAPIEYSIIFTRPQQPRAQNKKLCVTKMYTLHNPEIKMLGSCGNFVVFHHFWQQLLFKLIPVTHHIHFSQLFEDISFPCPEPKDVTDGS